MWRAHINKYGNFWDDAYSPQVAMENAVKLWKKKGCPIDGKASQEAPID